MNYLVATDGSLDPTQAADTVSRLYSEGDSVTVFTVVSIPTDFLRRLGDSGVEEASRIALAAGATLGAGDRAAERLVGAMPKSQAAKGDSPVLAALSNTAAARTRPLVEALKERGIAAKSTWRSSEGQTAKTLLAKIKDSDADLVIVGSHGHGRFEGLLGSTGTKIVRHSPASVLVLRKPTGT